MCRHWTSWAEPAGANCRSSQSRADVKQSIQAGFLETYGFLLSGLLVIAFLPQIELSSHEELPTNIDLADRPEKGANIHFRLSFYKSAAH